MSNIFYLQTEDASLLSYMNSNSIYYKLIEGAEYLVTFTGGSSAFKASVSGMGFVFSTMVFIEDGNYPTQVTSIHSLETNNPGSINKILRPLLCSNYTWDLSTEVTIPNMVGLCNYTGTDDNLNVAMDTSGNTLYLYPGICIVNEVVIELQAETGQTYVQQIEASQLSQSSTLFFDSPFPVGDAGSKYGWFVARLVVDNPNTSNNEQYCNLGFYTTWDAALADAGNFVVLAMIKFTVNTSGNVTSFEEILVNPGTNPERGTSTINRVDNMWYYPIPNNWVGV